MYLNMLKGKIHRATVLQAELDYVGSITVDEDLLDASGILEYEKVQIVDVNNLHNCRQARQRHDLPERRGSKVCAERRQGHHHVLCTDDTGRGESFFPSCGFR